MAPPSQHMACRPTKEGEEKTRVMLDIHCLSPEMTHVTSVHNPLARIGHIALPNCKREWAGGGGGRRKGNINIQEVITPAGQGKNIFKQTKAERTDSHIYIVGVGEIIPPKFSDTKRNKREINGRCGGGGNPNNY